MNEGNSNSSNTDRPAVMDNMSETQMEELERAFNDSNKGYFDELGESYGWSKEDTAQVRAHFSERVKSGQDSFGSTQGQ